MFDCMSKQPITQHTSRMESENGSVTHGYQQVNVSAVKRIGLRSYAPVVHNTLTKFSWGTEADVKTWADSSEFERFL